MLQGLDAGAATTGRCCVERRLSVLQWDAIASGGRDRYKRWPALLQIPPSELQASATEAAKGGSHSCNLPPPELQRCATRASKVCRRSFKGVPPELRWSSTGATNVRHGSRKSALPVLQARRRAPPRCCKPSVVGAASVLQAHCQAGWRCFKPTDVGAASVLQVGHWSATGAAARRRCCKYMWWCCQLESTCCRRDPLSGFSSFGRRRCCSRRVSATCLGDLFSFSFSLVRGERSAAQRVWSRGTRVGQGSRRFREKYPPEDPQ